MKKGLDSRLNRALLLALVAGLLVLADRLAWQWMSAEVALVVAGGVLSLVGGRGLVLRRDDEAQAALSNPPLTAGELSALQEIRHKAKRASVVIGGGLLALCLLTGCPSPSVQTCPGPVVGEASRDVATGAPLYSLRCGASVLWRGVCGSPEARGEFLFCDGKPAYRLTGGPVEVIP